MDNVLIEQKAKGILIETFNSIDNLDIPIKIGMIAEKHGISIKEGDFKHPDVSGSYDRNSKTIIVDTDDEPTRQAFTVTHELGHHFLHKGVKEKEIYFRYFSERLNLEEKKTEMQANLFAASLLMPEEIVRKKWAKNTDERLLAKKFGVSQSAMHFQLMNLELLVEDGVPL